MKRIVKWLLCLTVAAIALGDMVTCNDWVRSGEAEKYYSAR